MFKQGKFGLSMRLVLLAVLVAVILGIPLGWALLFLLVMGAGKPKEPPTKEEWKVM